MERLRRGLTTCIGAGCLSFDHCELANPAANHYADALNDYDNAMDLIS